MDTVWKRRDCVSAEVDGSLVLLDLETLVYHSLNSTGAAIWQLLEQPQTQPALIASLCSQYDVSSEQCTASVERFLQALATSHLVAPEVAA